MSEQILFYRSGERCCRIDVIIDGSIDKQTVLVTRNANSADPTHWVLEVYWGAQNKRANHLLLRHGTGDRDTCTAANSIETALEKHDAYLKAIEDNLPSQAGWAEIDITYSRELAHVYETDGPGFVYTPHWDENSDKRWARLGK